MLFFADGDEATALQCVGSHVELERMPREQTPPEVLEGRRSRLVFIGRVAGLELALNEGFCGL